jgi:hypothetical protein
MKTSNSSVFISGIDDAEKKFSYAHPAAKQKEFQVEVMGSMANRLHPNDGMANC